MNRYIFQPLLFEITTETHAARKIFQAYPVSCEFYFIVNQNYSRTLHNPSNLNRSELHLPPTPDYQRQQLIYIDKPRKDYTGTGFNLQT